MKLHGFLAFTRDCRPRWLLNELGLPYEFLKVNLFKSEHENPEYIKSNPSGLIPFLEDGEVKISESGALLMYLADKYSDRGLAPKADTVERANYYQWMFYGATTLEVPSVRMVAHTVLFPDRPGAAEETAKGLETFASVIPMLEAVVSKNEFLLGNRFSAADIMVGSDLHWVRMSQKLEAFPVLSRYLDRLSERPAYQKAYAKDPA